MRAATRLAPLAAAVGLACGPPKAAVNGSVEPTTAPRPTRVVAESTLYVLESWGPPPTDTAVSWPAGERRVILLRHAPPDNSPFAELVVPEGALASGGTIEARLLPLPGIYGLEVQLPGELEPPGTLVFRYPVHFSAPAGAREAYGGDVDYEQALVIGQLLPGGRVALLPVTRPAADNLSAIIPGPGRYIVAAPR